MQKKTSPKLFIDLSTPIGRFAILVLMAGIFSLYFPINQAWGTVHSFKLPIDDQLPIVSEFVIVYVFGFFGWGAAYVLWTLWRLPKAYLRFMLAMLFAVVMAYIIYLSYQSTVPRPDLEVQNGFDQILKWVYGQGRRYNSFPSGHTYTTVILLLSTLTIVRNRYWRAFFIVLGLSIILSTVLLKQHYVLDPLAGIVVASFAWWLSGQAISYVYPVNPEQKNLPQ
ncbi:MAG: phosphatase PAP2 family protein [Candidatus Nomurabacteria bacterium]|nr:MAG: phosphatase PAP2 family protein [Candidatus Nomurabacteria bacterium]